MSVSAGADGGVPYIEVSCVEGVRCWAVRRRGSRMRFRYGRFCGRDRRLTARTRETAPGREICDPLDEDTDTSVAEVILLGLFDPLADPWRRQ